MSYISKKPKIRGQNSLIFIKYFLAKLFVLVYNCKSALSMTKLTENGVMRWTREVVEAVNMSGVI